MKWISICICILYVGVLTTCQSESVQETRLIPTEQPTTIAIKTPIHKPSPTIKEIELSEPLAVSISLGEQNIENGITQDSSGDVDTIVVEINGVAARQSGNAIALKSSDGNSVPDSYFQFNVDDEKMYAGLPTGHILVELDYLDDGLDTFSLEYDAKPDQGSNNLFTRGGLVVKTNSGEFRTATFNLCDAYFANRNNSADFRISDDGNGAEIIREVRVISLGTSQGIIMVDDYGANPIDDQPDSDAIQLALDSSCSGDTIVFTSGVNTHGYQGYLVDKTLFLTGISAKHDLTFTSSNPEDHALLRATEDLKGYVVRLYARSRFSSYQNISNIDFGYIDIHGGRDVRVCMGIDQIQNGVDDNWGSWLPECEAFDEPWCSPGNLAFDGAYNHVVVHDLVSQQGECGSGLSFNGENGIIQNVTIDTVGDHVHAFGCANTDNDGDYGGWSDGMTLEGRNLLVTNNTVINPSDIGIVSFGATDTIISNNFVKITPGNYGAFGGISVSPFIYGDASGNQIIGNTIINEGDSDCGGMHVGIYIGMHMWNGGCTNDALESYWGNPTCSTDPNPEDVGPCESNTCQLWAVHPEGETFIMKDNSVTGAHINYLVQGFLIEGEFIDENNISLEPRRSDWNAARYGCNGVYWVPLDKVAHNLTLPGYTDLVIHCER